MSRNEGTAGKIFRRPVEGALYMRQKGFKVFPLKRNGKTPLVTNWQEWAETADEIKIEQFGRANPMHNWGVYCGASGLLVVDIDAKNDKQGYQTLKDLQAENGKLPDTLQVSTPSGGAHLYFSGSGGTTAGKLGNGLDTRGEGGYVVAPGSRIDDRTYEVIRNGTPRNIPEWLSKKLTEIKKEKTVLDDNGLVEKGQQHSTLVSLAGTMRSVGMTEDAIAAALLVLNDTKLEDPAPEENIREIARSISQYEPNAALIASDFLTQTKAEATTADQINIASIKPRDWIMDRRYIGGFISLIVAPGGVGKSTISMLDAVSIATGKNLTGFNVTKPGAVWVYNTEDPQDELYRKFAAVSIYHKIPLKQLKNVHITSGRDKPFILAKSGNDGVTINKHAINETINYIREHNIRVFIADPFIRTHEVQENDNMHIDKVVWCFQRIADATGCAIGLVHHTSKGNGSPGDMDKARGASSLVSACRIAHTVTTMTEQESKKFGVKTARQRWYVRLDNAKANLQPPAESADWFEKVSVKLPNGDDVGTVKRISMIDYREEKQQEQIAGTRYDIARCLCQLFTETNTSKPLTRVADHIAASPYKFLFDNIASEKHQKLKLIEILKTRPSINNMVFDFEERTGKPAYWVVCTRVNGADPDDSEPKIKFGSEDYLG